jgi:hypothetical protein
MNPEMALLFIALEVCLTGAMILLDKKFARQPVHMAVIKTPDVVRPRRQSQRQDRCGQDS